MIELASIEVQMFHTVLAARKYHRDAKCMRESRFIVDATTSAASSLREIRNNKTRFSQLGDDSVVNLVGMFYSIYSNRVISTVLNCWFNALEVGV